MSDKGFTILEMLFVLLILSVFTLMMLTTLPKNPPLTSYVPYLKEKLLQAQIRAVYERRQQDIIFSSAQMMINDTIYSYPNGIQGEHGSYHFNENGNISRAGTVCFSAGVQKLCMVLELGSGRIVLR